MFARRHEVTAAAVAAVARFWKQPPRFLSFTWYIYVCDYNNRKALALPLECLRLKKCEKKSSIGLEKKARFILAFIWLCS